MLKISSEVISEYLKRKDRIKEDSAFIAEVEESLLKEAKPLLSKLGMPELNYYNTEQSKYISVRLVEEVIEDSLQTIEKVLGEHSEVFVSKSETKTVSEDLKKILHPIIAEDYLTVNLKDFLNKAISGLGNKYPTVKALEEASPEETHYLKLKELEYPIQRIKNFERICQLLKSCGYEKGTIAFDESLLKLKHAFVIKKRMIISEEEAIDNEEAQRDRSSEIPC